MRTALLLTVAVAAAAAAPARHCSTDCTRSDSRPCVCSSSGHLVGSAATVEFPDVEAASSLPLSKRVHVWLGIPYALPPVGRLRFARPQPFDTQPGQRLDCDRRRPACPQPHDEMFSDTKGSRMWLPNANQSEDCLHLNVWAPVEGLRRPLATMVWIYGGSFTSGTSTLEVYDGRYLAASQNVIVVSMNYRLGPYGFLYLANSEAPGNMGLWDQWLALKWVKQNIANFGGDPSRISLFGESAGAVSVSLHTLSPWSQTLFNHAIMQSGGHHCNWAAMSAEVVHNKSLAFAAKLGCHGNDAAGIVGCMRRRSNRAVMSVFSTMFLQKNYFEFVFSPVFDRDFLPFRNFRQVLRSARKFVKKGESAAPELSGHTAASASHRAAGSQMFGINRNEGTYFLLYAFLPDSRWRAIRRMDDRIISIPNHRTFDSFIQKIIFPFKTQSNRAYNRILFERAKFHYSEDDDVYSGAGSRGFVRALDRMSSDLSFRCPVISTAYASITNHSRVFVYEFNYRQRHLPWPKWTGVMHGYEIDFVFGAPFNAEFQRRFYLHTHRERVLSWYVMKYWANFAKTGDPNLSDFSEPFFPRPNFFINWQPANSTRMLDSSHRVGRSHNLRTLEINASGMFSWSRISDRQMRDCNFWKSHVVNMHRLLMARGAGGCDQA